MSSKPLLVLFSPLPPKPNGIADYVVELLPEHLKYFEVICVIDDLDPPPELGRLPVSVLKVCDYARNAHRLAKALHVYHLGNNNDHAYITDWVLRRPGIVVIHDYSLNWLLRCHFSDRPDLKAVYAERLGCLYGISGRYLAQRHIDQHEMDSVFDKQLPGCDLFAAASLATIVHSRYVYDRISARLPGRTIIQINHHLSPVAADYRKLGKSGARNALSLPQDIFLFVSLGFMSGNKGIDKALEALAAVRDRLPPFRYVLAGEERPHEIDLRAIVARLGLDEVVEFRPYLDAEDFFRFLVAADLVINLRHPTGGETSGTLVRALGLGACVVVTDGGAFRDFPASTVIRVPWDQEVVHRLGRVFTEMANSPAKRQTLGSDSIGFIDEFHGYQRSAASYNRLLCRFADRAAALPEDMPPPVDHYLEKRVLYRKLRAYAQDAFQAPGELWWREAAVPVHRMRPSRIGWVGDDVGGAVGRLLKQGFDYPEDEVSFFPVPEEPARNEGGGTSVCDRIVWVAPFQQILERADAVLPQLNACLGYNSLLIIETWGYGKNAVPSGGQGLESHGPLSLLEEVLGEYGFRPAPRADWAWPSEIPAPDLDLVDPELPAPADSVLVYAYKYSDVFSENGVAVAQRRAVRRLGRISKSGPTTCQDGLAP